MLVTYVPPSSGPYCPLLPLSGHSRHRLSSQDVPLHPPPSPYPPPPSSVTMVSGLHPAKMNCTRIFNLFCLYGNIEKVSSAVIGWNGRVTCQTIYNWLRLCSGQLPYSARM